MLPREKFLDSASASDGRFTRCITMAIRIRYNAPVVLTFSLLAAGVTLLGWLTGGSALRYFAAPSHVRLLDPLFYFTLLSHVFGHAGWAHLAPNLALILLIGPLLEEKHRSLELLEMIAITALVTGLANALFFDDRLLGASGVAFMMILLASLSSLRKGEIPLTFLLVAALYLGRELFAAFGRDNISQLAHLAGAACGAAFGIARGK